MKSKYDLLNELIEFIIQKCDEVREEAFEDLIDIYDDYDTMSCYNELCKKDYNFNKTYLEYCIDVYKEDNQDE